MQWSYRIGTVFALAVGVLAQDKQHKMNRLANETSPYLLQHKLNPVHWYPWGEEALARAKKENKVIFLSIGYSACHWCHVMERESFENDVIAKQMNDNFICIKVDREERPDIDEIYMAATTGLTGSGGWPMSVFMTPELKPFFAGTYYPPKDMNGRPGFPTVLTHVAKLWKERRKDVLARAGDVTKYLEENLAAKTDPADPKPEYLVAVTAQSASRYDDLHGGFGSAPRYAPKFPHASELSLLLRVHARSGDKRALEIVETTLAKMARGGIYDQLRGGFHRYSTDRVWLAPHFEKMLYDNSQLVRTYAEAWQLTRKAFYLRIVRETLDYMLAEMQDASGGFYSTQDADSEGVEGKFFVWSRKEFDSICGDDAEAAARYWGAIEAGNWEEHNILHVAESLAEGESKVPDFIARVRPKLLAVRSKRIHPATDDKILAAWNGLAIAACSVGYQVTGDARYLKAAQRAADFVLTEMTKDGRLLRTSRKGRAHLMAYLEDYAFVCDGLICLFESDFDPRWLKEAKRLSKDMIEHFHDASDGNFFFTADDHEKLITRTKSINESSTPSGIAIAAMACLRLGTLLGDAALYDIGYKAVRANHEAISRNPVYCSSLMHAVDFALGDPREIVIAGEMGDPATLKYLQTVRQHFPQNIVVTLVHSGNKVGLNAISSVFGGKEPIGSKAAVYVCRQGACEAPITDPAAFILQR